VTIHTKWLEAARVKNPQSLQNVSTSLFCYQTLCRVQASLSPQTIGTNQPSNIQSRLAKNSSTAQVCLVCMEIGFNISLHLGRNQWLALPLGRWHAQHQPCGWFYHQTTNSLWEASMTQWVQHGSHAQCTQQ